MPMPAMNKIARPDFTKINDIHAHEQGKRLVGHQTGAISTGERLMQFNTQDLAGERGGPAAIGKGTMTSLVQFGNS